jgi:hypothetical protein
MAFGWEPKWEPTCTDVELHQHLRELAWSARAQVPYGSVVVADPGQGREPSQDRNPLAGGDNFVNAASRASPNGGPPAGGIGRYGK